MKKLILFLLLIITLSSCHWVTVNTTCTVISHSTTSDKYGAISYYTECSCSDGEYKSLSGLQYYVKPTNSTFNYSYEKIK
jgi:hypothetical protein